MKSSKFEKHQNLLFSVLFLIGAIFCFVGFLNGHMYHLYTTVLLAILSLFFNHEYKKTKDGTK